QLGLQGSGVAHGVTVPRDPIPPGALVKTERIRVVVRRDEPQSLPSRLARMLDDAIEERGTCAGAAIRRRDRDELGVAFDLVPERAANRTAVPLDDEPVECRRVLVDPAAGHDARGDELRADDIGDPGAVVLAYAADLHTASSLHSTRFLQRLNFGVAQTEHGTQSPLIVFTERGPGRFITARAGGGAETVARVDPVALDHMRMRLEVTTVRELRVFVEVGEVVHRHGLDARRLQLVSDRCSGSTASPRLDVVARDCAQ